MFHDELALGVPAYIGFVLPTLLDGVGALQQQDVHKLQLGPDVVGPLVGFKRDLKSECTIEAGDVGYPLVPVEDRLVILALVKPPLASPR